MVNKELFAATRGAVANTTNRAGGAAYDMGGKHALAQLAVTGTLSDTYYASAQDHLTTLTEVLSKCDDLDYVAKVAVFAREKGYMKDMPAILTAWLRVHGGPYEAAFNRTITNGKMLRNFVQVIRSGVFSPKKSITGRTRRLLRKWFQQDPDYLLRQSLGNDPSFRDILRLVKPTPRTKAHKALFAHLVGKPVNREDASDLLQSLLTFRESEAAQDIVPNVPFQMVDSLPLRANHWSQLIERGGWHFVRMNLNTAARRGLIPGPLSNTIASKLKDEEAIEKAKVFPYQLLMAYKAFETNDQKVKGALHDALEIATKNVPSFEGTVAVFVDSSGSMSFPATGYRRGATSNVTCSDIAGMFAACIVRKNPNAIVVSFDSSARIENVEPRDTCMTIAKQLAKHGGATDCSAPFRLLESRGISPDLCITISDSESWSDPYGYRGKSTPVEAEFQKLKRRNPKAKDVRIDIQATTSEQRESSKDTLLVGGFSDSVFETIARFQRGADVDTWVSEIETLEL